MGAVDLILLLTFGVMTLAAILDRAWAGADSPAAPLVVAVPPAAPPATEATPAAVPLPDLAEISAKAQGWALLGPAGTVVATNLPERAALLAGACAMLRLASGGSGERVAAGEPLPWRTVTLEGPSGILLGEASPSGAVLAVLARRGADDRELRAAMGLALAEVERRWSALPGGAPAFGPGSVAAPDGGDDPAPGPDPGSPTVPRAAAGGDGAGTPHVPGPTGPVPDGGGPAADAPLE